MIDLFWIVLSWICLLGAGTFAAITLLCAWVLVNTEENK